MKIKRYHVAQAFELDYLEDKVNELIEEGWQPLGGVCFSSDSTVWDGSHGQETETRELYSQAMVKIGG